MSESFVSINDEDWLDCVRVLEFRYAQEDLQGIIRTTQVGPLGYARGLERYLLKRLAGETHDMASRAMLAEIDDVLYPDRLMNREWNKS